MLFLLKKKHDIFYVLFYGQKANFPWRKKYIHSTLTGCGNNKKAVLVYTVIHQMGSTRPQRVMVRLKNIHLYLPHIFLQYFSVRKL